MRILAVASTVLLFAAHAHATVIDVPADAQVCRFAAASASDPLKRWFTAREMTCTSPSAMTFPDGRWNVFARTKSAVSVAPLLVDSRIPPDVLHLDTAAGAMLIVQLPPATSGLVYFPKHAAAVLVDARTIVPADEELWLFVLAKGVPAGVFVIAPVPAGVERPVDARVVPASRALLAWVAVPDADQAVLRNREVDVPSIRATNHDRSIDAAPLPHARDLGGALVLFPNAGTAPLDLDLKGRGWLPEHATASPGPGQVTVVQRPLAARLSANLTVNWSTVGDLKALNQSLGECVASTDSRFELTISACTSRQESAREGASEAECRPFRTEALLPELTYGSVNVGEVAPGTYRAEIRYGKLPLISATMALAPLDQRPLYAQARYLTAYGSLTRGGQPVDDDAAIAFPAGGKGFARRGEDYKAVLKETFDTDAKIEVVTCKGERTTVLAERPLSRNSRFDIDIPNNLLKVKVVDTFTRTPLTSSKLRCIVMSKELPRHPVLTLNLNSDRTTAEANRDDTSDAPPFAIRSVPPDRQLALRVSSAGYKTQDVDPFSISKSDTREIEVQLVPINGNPAKVVSARPFDRATIYWFAPDGTETEHAELAADGTFTYEGPHYRNEAMVVVSKSHPLWVAHAPIVDRRSAFKVAFPDAAPVRNIQVLLPGYPQRLATLIGLAVGGVRVPAAALAEHLGLRGLPPFVTGAGPMFMPMIAETSPIDVLRGPSVAAGRNGALPPGVRADFTAGVVRRLQPGNDTVSLEGK